MDYVYIKDGKVNEIIPEIDPAFPGVPIDERYSSEFLQGVVAVPDGMDVQPNMLYTPDTGEFNWPEPLPVPELVVDLEAVRAAKLAELSAAGNAAIVAGVDVTLPSTGEVEHFALMETDQINLSTAMSAVEQGAEGYPYHADGQLCRMYPATDILAVSDAAIRHKLYHTTYCNHLLVWARRSESVEELTGITYGAKLPEDLAANLAAVLAAAGGIANA